MNLVSEERQNLGVYSKANVSCIQKLQIWLIPWWGPSSGPKNVVILRVILNYSLVQIASWEANWFADSQEIPHILWNPKVHYHTHKRPPTLPILGQPNSVHTPTSHLLEILPNIIHPSAPRSPQWSLSLWFPHQDPIHPPSPHPSR